MAGRIDRVLSYNKPIPKKVTPIRKKQIEVICAATDALDRFPDFGALENAAKNADAIDREGPSPRHHRAERNANGSRRGRVSLLQLPDPNVDGSGEEVNGHPRPCVTAIADHPSRDRRFAVHLQDRTHMLDENALLDLIEAACSAHGGYQVVRKTEKK